MPGRAVSSSDVTPEQSLLPAPELTNDPVSVEEEPVGAAVTCTTITTITIITIHTIATTTRAGRPASRSPTWSPWPTLT